MIRTLFVVAVSSALCSNVTVAGSCPLSARKHAAALAHPVAVEAEGKNIVETAASAGSFQTLLAAAKAAGLVDALTGPGPLTLFAPTDEAFNKLPAGTVENLLKPENKAALTAVLLYHVVPGRLTADKVVKLSGAQSKQGEMVRFKVAGDTVTVGGAQVVSANIACTNGVIHVIDAVILPPSMQTKAASQPSAPTSPAADIVDTAVGAGAFKTLVAAVQAAGLVDTLKGEGPLTVFAPTDEAFSKLPAGTVENLLKPENKDQLIAILTCHVVPGAVYVKDVAGLKSAKTVNGKELSIATAGGGVQIDGAQVITADIECVNGVIHVIDTVILP